MNEESRFTDAQFRELQAFKEKSRKLLEHFPAMVFSRDGKITQINPAAEKLLGISEENVLNKSFHQLGCTVVNEQGKKIKKREHPWTEALTSNKTISNSVTGIARKDKPILWLLSNNMPISPRNTPHPTSVIATFTDITIRHHAQIQSLQSQKMEALGSLAGGLAHDFNNILTSIRSSVQLLLLENSLEKQDMEALKDIENETLRGAELIKQLLLFSRPHHTDAKTTELNSRIQELSRLLKRTLPKDINIELNLYKSKNYARISPTQLEQILLNLAINAKQAMPSGGTLSISSSIETWNANNPGPAQDAKHGRFARIDIRDNGSGIPASSLGRIFEPFFTSRVKNGGTGLGLSIVYAIIKQHDGYILTESTVGEGTCFSIFLPASRSVTERITSSGKSNEKPRGGYETILVADDELIIRRSTARFLERYGYHTILATDGRDALNTYLQNEDSIDLVLLDLEMPKLSGRECMEHVLNKYPATKIITLSGHIIKAGEWNPLDAGASFHIQKPFDSNNLIEIIRQVLDTGRRKSKPAPSS